GRVSAGAAAGRSVPGARARVSRAPRGATGGAGGASFRAAIFPVRQATSTENVQVGAPLRVRNG
ncbi:undecaprenyl/decaprenyl-phosphate alpha-N-acetylglucosaminyl 1-phosphate transferase, partial [Streptomyces sp. SID5926]|nr:undecaprenyl/decaprenyl-phosphate alpha-N-acetylglucosaminyl 1-phosphate transferase [Streptomyces sp. SID5926]